MGGGFSRGEKIRIILSSSEYFVRARVRKSSVKHDHMVHINWNEPKVQLLVKWNVLFFNGRPQKYFNIWWDNYAKSS